MVTIEGSIAAVPSQEEILQIFCCREEGRETFKLDKTWFSLETHIDQPQNGESMNKHLSC